MNNFELVRELTDDEFSLIYTLITSRKKYPDVIIDVNKHAAECRELISLISEKRSEMDKLERAVDQLERKFFYKMVK